jgi:hypothetical protein
MSEAEFLIMTRIVCIVPGFGIHLPRELGDPAIIYMERLEGGPLVGSKLDATGRALCVIGLVEGVRFLQCVHAMGPWRVEAMLRNVLLAANGYPKIADFGPMRYAEFKSDSDTAYDHLRDCGARGLDQGS